MSFSMTLLFEYFVQKVIMYL